MALYDKETSSDPETNDLSSTPPIEYEVNEGEDLFGNETPSNSIEQLSNKVSVIIRKINSRSAQPGKKESNKTDKNIKSTSV